MGDSQASYAKLINNFKQECERWQSSHADMEFIFNEQLNSDVKNISDIKYLVIADNPGEKEKEKKCYLFEDVTSKNRAGYIAHEMLRRLDIEEKSVLFLNKTPIYTKESENLKKFKDQLILNETMEYMAQLTFNINKLKTDAQVIIFGLGGCFDSDNEDFCETELFSSYYKKIRELYLHDKTISFPIIVKHFSHYSFLQDFVLDKYGKTVEVSTNKLRFNDLNDEAIAKNFLVALKSLPYSSWLKEWK